MLTASLDYLTGQSHTTKHPADPDVPEVAAEVAAARALRDVADQLQRLADARMRDLDRLPLLILN